MRKNGKKLKNVLIEQQHTRGQGLLELVDLVGLLHDERVQVLAAADLELGVPLVLLDLDPYGNKEAG